MPVKMKISDTFDFRVLPHPKSIVPSLTTQPGPPGVLYNEKAGQLEFSNLAFPNMHIMCMGWQTANEDLLLFDDPTADGNININFQLNGDMYTTFPGLPHNLDMKRSTHNLVFIPDPGDVHSIKKNQTLSLLHISLDKDFFMNCIGQNDAWSERAYETISKGRPFSGKHGTLHITAQMQQLIHGIYHCKETAPMRSLLIQSRTLELLALQIGQFTQAANTIHPVKNDDIDKLHRLKAYIDEHFLDELSLSQLAKISLLNEFKLKSGFKVVFSITVFGYIRNLRMNYAKQLLLDMSMTVAEVAMITGYEHTQHFSAAFKKHFGINPSLIRK